MKDVFIIDGVRTPFGKFRGSLSPVRADDLAALPIRALLDRNPDINPEFFDDVIMGCANQAGEDNRNVARMSLLLAGLPYSVPGETINRLCASGMSSVVHASRAIQTGDAEMVLAGGVEHMTRGPWVISKVSSSFGNDAQMHDTSFGWRFVNGKLKDLYGTDSMGATAENLVEMFRISREDQDRFAYWSQVKAGKSQESGRLAREISPVEIPQRKGDPVRFDRDEFVKPNTTTEVLARLRTAFKSVEEGGTVTAGNASGLNDGACALIVASEKHVKNHRFQPMARIVSSAVVGVEPQIMGIGPVPASITALKKAGLGLADMDIIEINEAFAAQVLACTRKLELEDDDPRVNPNGGAIAIGHPLGASGARLVLTAAFELHLTQQRYALATMCVGVGQGYAIVLERV